MSDLIQIDVMQSTWDSKYWALAIDGLRCGPDAGPWRTRRTFSVPVKDIERVLRDRADQAQDENGRASADGHDFISKVDGIAKCTFVDCGELCDVSETSAARSGRADRGRDDG